MPKKLPPATLSDTKPSADEVEKAKKLLDGLSRAERRSREGSLANFLENNPDAKVRNAVGQDKERHLIWFMARQAKAKEGEKQTVATREVLTDKGKGVTHYWWSEKNMNDEMGERKATAWRASGKVTWRPDPITGLGEKEEDFEHRDWKIPVEWETMDEHDINKLMASVSREMADGDDELIAEASTMGVASSSSTQVPVKVEPESELEVLRGRCEEIKSTPDVFLRTYQDNKTQLDKIQKVVSAKTKADKYAAFLDTDLSKTLKKVVRTVSILEKMIKDEPDDAGIPQLVGTIDAIDKEFDDLKGWAVKLGYYQPDGTGRRKRAKTSS
ncbi:unnamed protein product [Prorocentrum cordatum]|uniref:Uncharacterized protein n=1 Tax=Prorocentrum cordatum TaxID=2364126 RepID=A0ABN9SED8_9DINO|nr:unnamed protein product [Polarella glacialis]